jgi:hypothetical protein
LESLLTLMILSWRILEVWLRPVAELSSFSKQRGQVRMANKDSEWLISFSFEVLLNYFERNKLCIFSALEFPSEMSSLNKRRFKAT